MDAGGRKRMAVKPAHKIRQLKREVVGTTYTRVAVGAGEREQS